LNPQKWLVYLFVICMVVLFSSCTSVETKETPPPPTLLTLDADQISSLGENCSELYNAHIAAWNSKEPDNLREIYTEDIVHFDGYPLFVGIEDVVSMARNMYMFFPAWEMEVGQTYISDELCLGTWENWGVFGFTQEAPGLEFDLMTTRDGRISFWRAFYDQLFYEAFSHPDLIDDVFLAQFVTTWSSGDMESIMDMYAPDAVVDDGLFGYSVSGESALSDYMGRFLERSSQAEWVMLESFAEDEAVPAYREDYPFPAQGGIFALSVPDAEGNTCEIRLALIITPNDEGLIISQQVYYQADTLLACGWAEQD
jgi:ketosteroid isomerase-like protein